MNQSKYVKNMPHALAVVNGGFGLHAYQLWSNSSMSLKAERYFLIFIPCEAFFSSESCRS